MLFVKVIEVGYVDRSKRVVVVLSDETPLLN